MHFDLFCVSFWACLQAFQGLEMADKQCKSEQRVALKFLVHSGKRPCECLRSLRAVFGQRTMSETQIWFWHKRFKNGDMQTSTTDRPRSGRPRSQRTQKNIEAVRTLLQGDQRRSVRELASETNLSESVTFNILRKDLNVRKHVARLVPTFLSETQKEVRAQFCDENLRRWRGAPDTFLSTIVTCDETWISTFEQETKRQSSVWLKPGVPCPQHPRRLNNAKKTMLTLFFDEQGVILAEFLEKGGTVTSERFIKTLSKMKEAIRKKRPKLWAPSPDGHRHNFILQMDNASPHTAQPTMVKLEAWQIRTLAHPPNSPDLAPCNFTLFPKLKEPLRGKVFKTVEDLQQKTLEILRRMPTQVFFQAISDLTIHWQKCLTLHGAYFEGAHVPVDIETFEVEEVSEEEED